MPRLYGEAILVEEIAAQLIPQYHPELATAAIKYITVDKASKKNGKAVPGKARRISGAWSYLVEADFLIEVAQDVFNDMSERERHALVDHLLERCTGEEDEGTGEMKWIIREPDCWEFSTILSRHGAWHEALTELVAVAQQLNLEARIQEVDEAQVRQSNQMV